MTESSNRWKAFQLYAAPGWQVTVVDPNPTDPKAFRLPSAMSEAQAKFVVDSLNLAETNGEVILTSDWLKMAVEGMAEIERIRATGTAWRPIATAPFDRLVLVRGDSGHVHYKKFVIAVYRTANYRRGDWLDPTNTRLSDSGWVPEEWMEVPA